MKTPLQAREGSREQTEAYYRSLFREMEETPVLAAELNDPSEGKKSLRCGPGPLTAERVRTFCEGLRITEFAFFQGAMALLLNKYMHSRQVSFFAGSALRRFPVYGDLRRNQSVEEYLRAMAGQLAASMAREDFPFEEILKLCPVSGEVELLFQDGSAAGAEWPPAGAGCLSVRVCAAEGLYSLTAEYPDGSFSETWVRRLARDLFTAAEGLLTCITIAEVSLLTAEDRLQLDAFNDTRVPMDFVPVQEQIRLQARKTPEKTAVRAAGQRLSFGALDALSDRLARVLREKGAGRDSLIGVLFDREIWAYVAEIAVLKAGAAFLPFIPGYPDERINFCMEDGQSCLLLTTRVCIAGRQLQGAGYQILTLEEVFGTEDLTEISAEKAAAEADPVSVAPEDLAYCIYTSGSTGRPKGVMIEHRNIANYVHRNEKSVEIIHYAAPGRVSLALASFSFDVSVVEEFVPLCNGNTVVIATEAEIRDPAAFSRLIAESGADGITCTPTYLLSLLEIPESREALRRMTFFDIGAEAFPRQLYDRLRSLRPDSVILNVYGPTECTMGCAAALMTGGEQVTVGRPMANTAFYVADTFGNALPVGLRGELIICGDQVGRGYVGLPEKTAAAFFSHDGMRAYRSGDLAAWTEEGEIRIFGRLDNQIKLRGFRIELDEIEKVMTEFPGISAGAATVRKTGATEYLAGYYTASEKISAEALKRFLREKMPEYMVPAVLMRLDEMPLTVNGKVDRKALPEPEAELLQAEYVPPETETERVLCAAFARVLKLEKGRVGRLDDFFDLCGDSLKAMAVLAEAKLEGLTAADVFRLRTPGAIAQELARRAGRESLAEREKASRLVPHSLSPLQRQMIDDQLYRPESTMWSNMHILARFGENVDADRLCAAVNQALQNHPALSVAFFFDERNELKQKYVPGLLPPVEVRDLLPGTEDALGEILVLPFRRILDACLCRVNVFRGHRGSYLFLDMHHLLMDGGSLGVLLGDIVNAYAGRALKPDYYFAILAEQEEREQAGQLEKDRAYFRDRYGDGGWCNILPPDHPDGGISQAGRMRRLAFDAEQVKAAEEYWGVSHSVMAVSAGLLALSRFTGEKHVMINWIFNNRLAPETENSVGMLIRNLPAAARMEEIASVWDLLLSVKEQVAEGIAHCSWDFMSETLEPYVNDCMEVNLQLSINAKELDELGAEQIPLADEFSAAGARLEMELLENEYGDGGFDSEMEYAEGLFDAERMAAFHDLYIRILESLIHKTEP